jgi:hypothetical protein
VTNSFVDSRIYVFGIWPPNGADLMRGIANAFEKVLSAPEAVMTIKG